MSGPGGPVAAPTTGRLVLVPNALDLGTGHEVDLRALLPQAVMEQAARLSHWVVENAKSARALLKRVDALVPLAQPLQRLNIVELPRPAKGAKPGSTPSTDLRLLLAPALQGQDIGLLSEAGMPAVADPGAALVQAAHGLGIPVLALTGPSALLLALASSGLNGQSFAFVGYLPVDAAARAARIRELEMHARRYQQTQLAIETPYRNGALLGALVATLQPGTWLSLASGLTLPDSQCRTMTVADWRRLPALPESRLPSVFGWLPA